MADDSTSVPTALDTPMSEARRKAAETRPSPTDDGDGGDGGDGGDERFAVKAEIARGGMGRVLAAHDRQLGRTVAIKEMLESSRAHERRFEREVEITARLQHPSILPLYDSRRWRSGSPYYVMRLVRGRPLADAIRACDSLDERLALVPNVLAAADAIAFAHSEGIIHRDIKPSNILVGDHGETVVIDWGIAKIIGEEEDDEGEDDDASSSAPPVGDETMPGAVLGTAGYMAPEQAVGKPVDERADVYALGATLYELLAGKAPYGGADSTRLVAKQLSGPPTSINRQEPGTPRDLVAIVEKALAGAPDDRYRDAGAFAADLRAFTTGRLVAAHDYSMGQRLWRLLRRHRAAVAVAVTALVALAVVLSSSLARIRSERNQAIAASAAAQKQAEELLVSRAGALATSNPTTAAALLKRVPLTSSVHGKAREVFREARTRGIARRLPGRARHGITWLPDGETLLAVHHQRLWIHHLGGDHPGSRVLFETTGERPLVIALVNNGTAVAVAGDEPMIHIIDLEGSIVKSAPMHGPVTELASPTDGRFVAWLLESGEIGRTTIADLATKTFDHRSEPNYLSVSRDGRWIGASDLSRKSVVFRDEQPIELPDNVARPTFGNEGARVVVTSYDASAVIELELDGGELREKQRWVLEWPPATVFFDARNLLVAQTLAGSVQILFPSRVHTLVTADGMPLAGPSPNGVAVLLHEEIRLFESVQRTIRFPRSSEGPVHAVFSRHHAAVANLAGELHVWDLDVILPRRHHVNALNQFLMTSETLGFGLEADGTVVELDLVSGSRRVITQTISVSQLVAAPAHDSLLLNMFSRFQLLRISTGEISSEDGIIANLAQIIGPDDLRVARDNRLYRETPFTDAPAVLEATFAHRITEFVEGDELYVVMDDGSVSRGLGDDRTTTRLPSNPTPLSVADENGILLTVGRSIYRWRTGEPRLIATLPRDPLFVYPESLKGPNAGAVIAIADGAIYTIRDDGWVAAAMPRMSRGPLVSSDEQIAFGLSANKRIAVTSFQRSHTWLLGEHLALPRTIASAPDAPVFAVVSGADMLEIYDLRVVRGASALRLALEEATSATVGEDLESLVWPEDDVHDD